MELQYIELIKDLSWPAATTVLIIFILKPLLPYLKRWLGMKLDKRQINRDGVAAISMEERLAFVESKTLQLENNHIEHLGQDIKELSKSIGIIRRDVSILSERVARIEAIISK